LLGKREIENESGEEEQPQPQKVIVSATKKARPLDSFVIKIKRNTPANCNLYI
jgi:hypothetical protein